MAGIVPAEDGDEAGWQVYFGVSDVTKAVASVIAAGGTVLVEPEDQPEEGSLATIMDPQGGVLSLIQVLRPK